jgi:hypothetical protein
MIMSTRRLVNKRKWLVLTDDCTSRAAINPTVNSRLDCPAPAYALSLSQPSDPSDDDYRE